MSDGTSSFARSFRRGLGVCKIRRTSMLAPSDDLGSHGRSDCHGYTSHFRQACRNHGRMESTKSRAGWRCVDDTQRAASAFWDEG